MATETRPKSMRPVLRWAGGKSALVDELMKSAPEKWNRYVEPMLGGGALFFGLRPAKAVLADINDHLVAFYCTLKDRPNALVKKLAGLPASRELYYQMRAREPKDTLSKAVRFAYLNRLAWNGLYRVNRKGLFNVPIGDRLPTRMWDVGALHGASCLLQSAEVVASDFREIAGNITTGDFVFFDPPYPKGSIERTGFNRYSAHTFSDTDHRDLASIVDQLTKRSVSVMMTIADVPHLNQVYGRRFRRKKINSNALIACSASARGRVNELILTNY